MSAPLGNDFAMKYKIPENRQELCRKYCEHIEQGFSDASFPECDPDTIERYQKDFPEDFPTVREAKRKRLLFWEKIRIMGTLGKIKNFNGATYALNMKNRFHWTDRQDLTTSDVKFELPQLFIPVEKEV